MFKLHKEAKFKSCVSYLIKVVFSKLSVMSILVFLSNTAISQTISINTDKVLNKIPPFGYNMITANQGFGIIGSDGNFDPDILSSLENIELPILRFPGGTYANLYEWQRAIGPKETRGGMHGWKYIPDNNWFGPDEAAKLMEKTGGELVIVVNFNKGAQYAADWVEYMNAEVGINPNGGTDWAQVRANNGHPEPYNVKYWEIANEGGNERIWPRWPYNGDADVDQLAFNDPVFQNLATYGGTRSYTNQTLVRDNAWDDVYIKTKAEANETFQSRFYPMVRTGFSLKIGSNAGSATTWTLVNNFSGSTASALHYTLDENNGKITFGNGINGAIPPANQYVYVNYKTKQLDGHVQIYNAMKAVDPGAIVSDAFFFMRTYHKNNPTIVKYDGTQHHMGIETMDNFELFENNVFKNAVSLATGSFPSQIDMDKKSYMNITGTKPNFFLSEYGIFKNTLESGVEHSRTITSAIYYALINAQIAQRGDWIQMACINYLLNHDNNKEAAMREGRSHVNANGKVTEMYSKYFGSQLVSTTASNIPQQTLTYDPLSIGTTSLTKNVPKLYSHASIDTAKNEAYLMVINTTNSESIISDIKSIGKGFKISDLVAIKVLEANSLTAINTSSSPNNIRISDVGVPIGLIDNLNWTFKPATVTCFIFKKENNINITSIPTSTQVGSNLVVSYKYTMGVAGRVAINVTKNGGATASTFISTVANSTLNPAVAGIDVTGSFTVLIPANTIPTANLTGNENYRVRVELKDAGNTTTLAGDYTNINYVFTPSLGIDDNNLAEAILVYPNPVDSVLNIKNASNLSNASFSISNILGKTVVQSKRLNDTVDVSNLSSGIYILSVKSDEGVKHIKFQKK